MSGQSKKYLKVFLSFLVLFVIALTFIVFIIPKKFYPEVIVKNFLPGNHITETTEKRREQLFLDSTDKNPEECDLLFRDVQNESQVKNNTNYQVRFENLHFKKDGETFRTREFLDSTPEGDIKAYMVFSEDLEEQTTILEKKEREPGLKFLEFKKYITENPNEVIHTERGYESAIDDHYLIFVNQKLSGFQGKFRESFIECHFLNN